MTYRVYRSGRKTLALQIQNGQLIVRAPYLASREQIEKFVLSHVDWVKRQLARVEAQRRALDALEPLSKGEIAALAERARRVIPARVRLYAERLEVSYGRITIRNQRTRWGSCSAKGNLNFNCLLMLAPLETLDSVVVHELCHRKEMNHSARFYSEVLRVFPEYYRHHGWLKQNGAALMDRMQRGYEAEGAAKQETEIP